MTSDSDATYKGIVVAGELCAEEIGSLIRFRITDPKTAIDRVITAELRQISHDGSRTFLTFGELAACEEELDHGHPVMVDPEDGFVDLGLLHYSPEEDHL